MICSIVRRGESDESGSWKTTWMSLRILRRSARPVFQLFPPTSTSPSAPINPSTAMARVVLPEPDSPITPSVSPGKTWAGFWGGLAACALLAVAAAAIEGLPMLPLIAVTLGVGAYSVAGDLVESLCKRFAGLKDSGSLIPGHGGVLDRFDSLLAAAPCLMLGIELLGAGWS